MYTTVYYCSGSLSPYMRCVQKVIRMSSVKGNAGQGHLVWGARYMLELLSVAFQHCQSREILFGDTLFISHIKKNPSEFGPTVCDKIV